jgi:ABC-type multidrug transport system fused ATPase/permease subunit
MKNNKRSVTNNIYFLVKNTYKWDKKVLSYFGLFTIVTATLPFINIFAPKFLIDELMRGSRAKSLITILLSYFVISATLNYLNAFLEGAYSPRLMDIGFRFENLLNEKCMNMDFKYTHDPKTLNDIETAERAVSGNVTGILGVLRKLFRLFGAGIAFLGYVTIVFTLSPWVLLYLMVNVATIYCLTIRVNYH